MARYIGARYIPLLMGEHDKTKEYEHLSVVTHEGNSYTSKRAVPVGVELTNSKYWMLSGNFNAQISACVTNTNEMKETKADKDHLSLVSPAMFGINEGEDISDLLENHTVFGIDLQGKTYKISRTVNCNLHTIVNGEIIIDFVGNGIMYNRIDGINLENLTINATKNYQASKRFTNTSIEMKKCKFVNVKNVKVIHSDFGMVFCDSDVVQVQNSEFAYSHSGAFSLTTDMADLTSLGCNNVTVCNSKFHHGYEGIKGAYYCSNVSIYGNECYENERDGIDFACLYVDGLDIYGNTAYDNGVNAIEIKTIDPASYPLKANTSSKYTGVKVHDNLFKTVGDYSGVTIQNDSNTSEYHVEVYGNTLECASKRGIRIDTQNEAARVLVHDNTIKMSGNTVSGISIIHSTCEVFRNVITMDKGVAIKVEDQTIVSEDYQAKIYGNTIKGKDNTIGIDIETTGSKSVVYDNKINNGVGQYPIRNTSSCKPYMNVLDVVVVDNSSYPVTEDNLRQYRMSPNMIVYVDNPTSMGCVGLISTQNSVINAGQANAHFKKYIEIQ